MVSGLFVTLMVLGLEILRETRFRMRRRLDAALRLASKRRAQRVVERPHIEDQLRRISRGDDHVRYKDDKNTILSQTNFASRPALQNVTKESGRRISNRKLLSTFGVVNAQLLSE
jgi:hypothetical protein